MGGDDRREDADHGEGAQTRNGHRHVPRLPVSGAGPASGTSNYNQLVERIRDLPKQDSTNPAQKALEAAAKAQVAGWIAATRSGIDALAEMADVTQLGYINAGPNATSISDTSWGATLLRTGKAR